jgi:hypothetical protein
MSKRTVGGAQIAVFGGSYFNILDPDSTPVSIEAIANGLGNTCRFAGQCSQYYSVAQHSVIGSYFVDPGYEYEFLMHDASEGLIHDITKPLKLQLRDYQAIELRIETSFARQYQFTVPMPEPVKVADLRMLATEQSQIMGHTEEWLLVEGHKPFDVKLEYWEPHVAKQKFLERFYELRGSK